MRPPQKVIAVFGDFRAMKYATNTHSKFVVNSLHSSISYNREKEGSAFPVPIYSAGTGCQDKIALRGAVMARRDDPMDESRPKKNARQKRDRKKRASDGISDIAAAGTQPLGEHDSSGFQPWLQDDQYLIRSRTSQQRRNKSATSVTEGRVAPLAPSRGAQAARHELEMRAARVEELQRRVASGTYEVDSTALARRMLGMDKKRDPGLAEDS